MAEARALEDSDEQLNRACENRLVVHGLARLSADTRQELRAAAFTKLSEVLARTFPGVKYTLISTSYFDSEYPVYEGTLASVSESTELRRIFGKKSFAARKASGLKILNSVTPATRVRISILKTLTSAYKRLYPNGTGPLRTAGFVDAVAAMSPSELKLRDQDFQHAYRTAGRRFTGKLSSYFLVLSDSSPLASGASSGSRKRGNDGTPEGASSSRRANMEIDEVTNLQVKLLRLRL